MSRSHETASVMRRPGVPEEPRRDECATHHAGAAAHPPAFQIRTFSTELKNHVMVMDFVKSDWFPSQRTAKVCVVHRYQGLKTAEQRASRYEVRGSWGRAGGVGRQFTRSLWSDKFTMV